MAYGYRGGMVRRDNVTPPPTAWTATGADGTLWLDAAGPSCRLFTWDGLALLLRGYARGPSGLDAERLAQEIRGHYLEHGELAVDGLEGSFTLALLDAALGRILLYRNLVGSGFTYYHVGPHGFQFGSNLAALVDASGASPQPNRSALPGFFLYRCVSGRETLFESFYRLLPGEEICWGGNSLKRRQRHSLAHLVATPIDADPVEAVEDTLATVLRDYAGLQPRPANLLSGGIDSSYLQALWNRVAPGEGLPPSYSISVDHPRTWADTDYAVTASRWLGTRHLLVHADGDYANYLIETLATTGEPPNHVQSAYFGLLARSMVARGTPVGLCGEGADSLFGLGLANQVHNATLLRRLLPGRWLQGAAAATFGLLGGDRLAATFRLAAQLDNLAYAEHPVNRVAAFTDLQAVTACFGSAAVAQAAAQRRQLLDLYELPADPMQRLHAMGFLAEAMDSASLWATLFAGVGGDLLCPFLDSRLLRFALSLPANIRFPFRRPKDLLKRALGRHVPASMVHRPKLGFGQPIFEWLAPGGQLELLVADIGGHDFLDLPTLERLRARPSWFLYSLLCYDLWHQLFIERTLPRPQSAALLPEEAAAR